jgi:hypothetical protein
MLNVTFLSGPAEAVTGHGHTPQPSQPPVPRRLSRGP